jgi:hypothetical protein
MEGNAFQCRCLAGLVPLDAGTWSDLTNFTYAGPIVITDPSAVAGPKKFYRAIAP